MLFRRSGILLIAAWAALCAGPQSATSGRPPFSQLFLDPVCPVTQPSAPNATKQIHVLYYPTAKQAKLKDPQTLTLYIGFNHPRMSDNTAAVPFTKTEDHWEAILPLEKRHVFYGIFYVKDDKTGEVDDNGGNYWDLLPCTPDGDRDPNGVIRQADSYTGVNWPLGIHRAQDNDHAVSLLDSFVASGPLRSSLVMEALWNTKAAQKGGDSDAWAQVAVDIATFVDAHLNDGLYLSAVGGYIARTEDKLPSEFVDRAAAKIDSVQRDSKHSIRSQVMYSRAIRRSDPRKRIAALDEFVREYPNAIEAAFALESKFYTYVSLKDVPAAESALTEVLEARKVHQDQFIHFPNDHMLYLSLAELYIDNKVKLDEALKLTDQAQEAIQPDPKGEFTTADSFRRDAGANIAETRAKTYLALNQPQKALSEARKAVAANQSAAYCFVLAQALAGVGEKKKALSAYFDAALLPSNDDLKYASELRNYYIKHGFGDASHFEAVLDQRRADRFKAAKYVPNPVDQPAPAFEFTSLNGEKFDAASLRRKTVVVNFWSPG